MCSRVGVHTATCHEAVRRFVYGDAVQQLMEYVPLRCGKLLFGHFEQAQTAACLADESMAVVTRR